MKRVLAAVLAALMLANPAHAYPVVRGVYGGPTPVTGPVLVNTAVNIGALTTAGQGGVSLASQDVSSYGFPFKGLDLWDGNDAHTPVSWTITDTTSTAGYTPGTHWELDGTTSCKSTATTAALGPPTPRPCAAGVTAALNKGPYTFSVTATDVTGHTSAPATLTYTIVANTANLGDQGTNTGSSSVPAAWKTGAMPSGATIALSTGANWIAKGGRLTFQTLDFSLGAAHPVTFTWADAAKPGGLWEMELIGVKNFVVNGLTLTGPGKSPSGYWLEILGGSDSITIQDSAIIKRAADVLSGDTSKGLTVYASSNVTVNNFRGRYLPACLTVGNNASNVAFNNTWCRYMYVNFMDVSNFTSVTMNDTYFLSPMRFNAQHADALQFANVTNPNGLTINRIMAVQADGDALTQGPVFGGTLGGSIGYIDNGTPGVPGTTLHITGASNAADKALISGATLVSNPDTLGQSIAAGTQTTTSCSKTAGTSCTVSISQLLGSAASPVNIWSAPASSLQMEGVVYASGQYAGYSSSGTAGTTILRDFTYVKNNGYNNGQDLAFTSIQGSIAPYLNGTKSWNFLTASAAAAGNQVGMYSGEYITWDRVSGKPCNPNSTWPGTGAFAANCTSTGGGLGPSLAGGPLIGGANPTGISLTGTGVGFAGATYQVGCSSGCGSTTVANLGTVSNKTFDFRFDYPVPGGPRMTLTNTDSTLLNSGTFSISSGFMWDTTEYLKVNRSAGSQPANTTFSHVFFGQLSANPYPSTHTHDLAVLDFNAGDPQANLDTIPTATWAGKTDAQVVETYATNLAPKAGGDLDAGGGTGWYGALTPANDSGQICWNVAGTVWDHTKTCAQMGLVPIP